MGVLQNKEGERPAKAPPSKSHLVTTKVGENAIGDFISHFSLIVKWLFYSHRPYAGRSCRPMGTGRQRKHSRAWEKVSLATACRDKPGLALW